MRKRKNFSWIYIVAMVFTISGCKDDYTYVPGIRSDFDPTPYSLEYPEYFPNLQIPEDNPMTVEGVKLGRSLYYDVKLSENGPMEGFSCSACHNQTTSFSNNVAGTSVLAHVNLAWNKSFLWEGKVAGNLEDIMKFEVEAFFKTDMYVLKSDPNYPDMYDDAFGSTAINSQRTAYALAQFFRTLISGNSKYDRVYRHEESYTESELRGQEIFLTERGDCFHCHTFPLLTENLFHNNGLDSVHSEENYGRYNVTGNMTDMGLFKTPTLRNVELTAPYMHDGRYATLHEVVEHYNTGVKHSNTLDPIMTKPGKEFGLGLTQQDKDDLVAYLKTFTDTTYINNPNLGSPF